MPLTANNSPQPKLMAIASGGGHWVQLLRLTPAFVNCDATFVSVDELYRSQVPQQKFYVVNDATRWNKLGLIRMSIKLAWLILMSRPDIIISTGAAPGYVGLRLGRLLGARTIWIDSIANVEQLSLSGQKIGRYADLWLTQWPHLAQAGGPHYSGAVI